VSKHLPFYSALVKQYRRNEALFT